MIARPIRGDLTSLSDRLSYLLGLRVAIAVIVAVWAVVEPSALAMPYSELLALSAAYVGLAAVVEVVRRRSHRLDYALLTMMLLVDGLYLAAAMYVTGGTQSPIRFLVYLHLVAVSLLASYRTGLKIALWHSLLLFVVLYAQAGGLLAAVDVTPGSGVALDQVPVLNLTAFWLFALATSVFSALNERELRNRRADLQAIVDIGARLDEPADPVVQSRIVLEGLTERYGFRRGVVLGASDDRVLVLAAEMGETAVTVPTTAVEPDWIVRRAWERREILPVKRLDPVRDPLLASLLPDARNVLVAPMIADGRPAGAIVAEHPIRRFPGVERRIVSVLGQFASIAALNLRNAVLLKHVQDLAERDALTGAANRRMFQSTLERILSSADEHGPGADRVAAVLFIDIDDFKVINDTLGHAAGDALLVAVTERISALVRSTDLVARLGGDEFAILTEDDRELRRSRTMAERLVHDLRVPYLIAGKPVVVTSSVGIASARDAIDGAPDLVRNADVAMYMAKANGKSGFAVFDPEMHEAIRERHALSVELQRAIDLDQLRLVYQPIIDLANGEVAGVEALVRWQHPEFGLVMPGRFIEIAEETGAILPIGRWILREACRESGSLVRAGRLGAAMFVGVNVSAREVQQSGFVDGVRSALADTGLDPANLIVEITETALLKATPSTIATLDELRSLGVRTAIDDFGTGYFSLSHLRQFPIDVLKIAREFVQDARPDTKSSAVAGAIAAMGISLGIGTVAEGIETAEQAARMRALGCTYGQGFHFARPVAGDVLAEWLSSPRSGLEPTPETVPPVGAGGVPGPLPHGRARVRAPSRTPA